jgi:cell division control protein 6
VFNRLYEELNSIGGSIIVVLDEIDNLGRSDDLLYALPRARSTGKLENVRVSVIGISNDFNYVSNLSPKVKSTLCEKEIEFGPYDADQLCSILTRRVDVAFRDDTVEEGAIALCAAYAAQEKGSARQAIRILYEAGEVALSDGDDTVVESHVEAAHTTLERERIEEGIRNITPQDRLVLTAVALLEAEEETPSRTKHVYERYSQLCDALSMNGLHQRSIRDHLQDLAMQGILDTDRRQGGLQGGDYFVFSLNTSLQMTVNVLSESERYQDHGIDEVLSVAMQR